MKKMCLEAAAGSQCRVYWLPVQEVLVPSAGGAGFPFAGLVARVFWSCSPTVVQTLPQVSSQPVLCFHSHILSQGTLFPIE